VCVWVAVNRASSLLVSVFEGRQVAGTGPDVFTDGQPKARGAANTLRIGEQLHVGVAVAEIPEAELPLTPGVNYSYNLALGSFVVRGDELTSNGAVLKAAEVTPSADLKSERLLEDGTLAGHAHLALGYEPGELPGFALCPAQLTDLRILHGSCRRPGFVYRKGQGEQTYDGLAWVDDLIKDWRRGAAATPFDPNARPHQLFLTGDQIYADDVAGPLLPMLNRLGNQMVSRVERLPMRYPPNEDDKSKEAYLDAPLQKGFPTLAAFFDRMESEDKDPLEELKSDRRVRVLADPSLDRKYEVLYARDYAVDASVESIPGAGGPRAWPADLLHFPAELRRPVMECETKLTSSDLHNHLISFAEFSAMYVATVCNAAWPLKNGRPALATLDEIYTLPDEPLPQIWDLHGCFTFVDDWSGRDERLSLQDDLEKERAKDEKVRDFDDRIATLTAFYESLPRVRRALANVPTYMVFDDHDVTDDWNLGRAWRDQVHTLPLGRRILTNALATYAVFQHWGNDPKRYRDVGFRDVVVAIAKLFPKRLDEFAPVPAAMEQLGGLFGLNQPDPEKPPPRLKWHFTIDGARHRAVVLDTRTRRRFRSRYLPAGLLTKEAIDDQLPDPALKPMPAGLEVLVIVSQTAVIMPALAAAVIVPLATRMSELSSRNQWRNLIGVDPDNEIWPGDDATYEEMLRRLAAYRRVVVLSGEIHWGFSAQMSYWQRGLKRLDLDPGLEPDLDGAQLTTRLAAAFQAAGFPLSDETCVVPREGNDEWLIIDPPGRRMFLVRKEQDGLNVYEEDEPARFAQFTSSGLKNVSGELALLVPWLGFAFPLVDRMPSERLIWLDSTPPALRPPDGGRFPPAARDRLGSEPVMLPSGNWPPGTRIGPPPDACWRMRMARDERPAAERPEFARAEPVADFEAGDLEGSYRAIATAHARQAERFRFARGAMYHSNLGLVRFEHDDDGNLVARHDLYSHPPGRDEVMPVSVHRVTLDLFGEQRPQLRFDRADGD